MVLGQAEHLGFISCPEHQESAAATESTSSTADHCVCCQPLVNDSQSRMNALISKPFFVAIADERIADGPVKAIDLPPQLS